jgi:hypothetical protein
VQEKPKKNARRNKDLTLYSLIMAEMLKVLTNKRKKSCLKK